MLYVLASVGILHTLVVTVEEFSIKELDGNDGKDEVEEEVHNQDVEHILQRVDHTVKHGLHTHKAENNRSGKLKRYGSGAGKKTFFIKWEFSQLIIIIIVKVLFKYFYNTLSLGTRLIVFKGLSTRSTRSDLMTPRFSAPELPLKQNTVKN